MKTTIKTLGVLLAGIFILATASDAALATEGKKETIWAMLRVNKITFQAM